MIFFTWYLVWKNSFLSFTPIHFNIITRHEPIGSLTFCFYVFYSNVFFFSLLCWYIEVERYLVVHRKALLEALVEELPIDIPFLFQAHFHQNQSTKRVIDCTHSNGRWNHYQGKSNYHQLVSSTFKYIMQILQ